MLLVSIPEAKTVVGGYQLGKVIGQIDANLCKEGFGKMMRIGRSFGRIPMLKNISLNVLAVDF